MRMRTCWFCFAAIVVLAGLAIPASSFAEDGKALYDEKCKVCHSIGDDAGPMANVGGALDGVGTKRDAAWLTAYLADPSSKIEGAKMPKLDLTAEQSQALVTYLLTLK